MGVWGSGNVGEMSEGRSRCAVSVAGEPLGDSALRLATESSDRNGCLGLPLPDCYP